MKLDRHRGGVVAVAIGMCVAAISLAIYWQDTDQPPGRYHREELAGKQASSGKTSSQKPSLPYLHQEADAGVADEDATLLVGEAYFAGGTESCGCFGASLELTEHLRWALLIMMTAIAHVGIGHSRRHLSTSARSQRSPSKSVGLLTRPSNCLGGRPIRSRRRS